MRFSWDEKKRDENWRLRKVDFAEAVGIFNDKEIIESIDSREDYGEERVQALGQTDGIFYLVAYTWREDVRHVITAWKVGDHGKRRYKELFKKRDSHHEEKG